MNDMQKNDCGVYAIVQLSTGHRYIGGSARLHGRWLQHLNQLRHNKHHCKALQQAYDAYGAADFALEILERCALSKLRSCEQEKLNTLKHGDFNISTNAFSSFKGRHHTAKAKAMLSESASQRTGVKNGFFGRQHTARSKAKMARANLGKLPPNTLAVMADGVRYVSLTEAARQLDVSTGTIFFRIRSPNFDYHYCQSNA